MVAVTLPDTEWLRRKITSDTRLTARASSDV